MRLITIGAVTGVFGLKGELKVRPLIGDESLFERLGMVTFLFKNGEGFDGGVLSAKKHRDLWLVKVAGVASPEAAMAYKGCRIAVADDLLSPAGSDEAYWFDIEGALVIDSDGNKVGTLTGYIETGSHDVFEIKDKDGVEYMISNNPLHVLAIKVAEKTVTIDRSGLVASR